MRTPLKPPPPYCTALPFHASGRLISMLIGKLFGSSGAIAAITLQYCALAPFAAVSVAISALAILPPALGRPMRSASMVRPARVGQVGVRSAGDFAVRVSDVRCRVSAVKIANVPIPICRMVVSVPCLFGRSVAILQLDVN